MIAARSHHQPRASLLCLSVGRYDLYEPPGSHQRSHDQTKLFRATSSGFLYPFLLFIGNAVCDSHRNVSHHFDS